jgi:hypothetical protein
VLGALDDSDSTADRLTVDLVVLRVTPTPLELDTVLQASPVG